LTPDNRSISSILPLAYRKSKNFYDFPIFSPSKPQPKLPLMPHKKSVPAGCECPNYNYSYLYGHSQTAIPSTASPSKTIHPVRPNTSVTAVSEPTQPKRLHLTHRPNRRDLPAAPRGQPVGLHQLPALHDLLPVITNHRAIRPAAIPQRAQRFHEEAVRRKSRAGNKKQAAGEVVERGGGHCGGGQEGDG
jgi:hypothetical protein